MGQEGIGAGYGVTGCVALVVSKQRNGVLSWLSAVPLLLSLGPHP